MRLVSSISIPENQQRLVYTNSLLKQIAVLKYQDQSGVSWIFSNGIGPMSFSWTSSNEEILQPYFTTPI